MTRRAIPRYAAFAALGATLAGVLITQVMPTGAQPGKPLLRGNAFGDVRAAYLCALVRMGVTELGWPWEGVL